MQHNKLTKETKMKKLVAVLALALSLIAGTVFAAPIVDINTATVAQLQTVKGIGPAFAAAIVSRRPVTGYTGSNQLVSMGILPKGVYAKVKDVLVAKKAK